MGLKVSKRYFLLILFLINFIGQIQTKNLLCLLGVETETAEKWNKVLLTELSAKGHDLTVVTPSIWNLEDETNIEFIHLENTHRFLRKRSENNSNNNNNNALDQSNWKLIVNWYDQHMATCRGNLESTGISEALDMVLNKKRSFDLIIFDMTYGPGCLLHLAYFYKNIPIVGVTSSTLTSDILTVNQPKSTLNPAIDPFILSDFQRNMNFGKRLYNNVLYGFDYVYRQWVVRPVIEGLWSHNRHVEHLKVPKSLNQLLPRFKLFLVNHHPILHTLTSLPANIIPVPGLHINNQKTPKLNSELVKYVDKAKKNLILIDLNANQLEKHHITIILEVIRKFPNHHFIWNNGKNKELIKNKPSNLFLQNNLDKQELMAFTEDLNKIAFVLTTPDILSVQECLYYGLPMITITLKPEQRYLVQRIEEQGFGLNLQLNNFSLKTLEKTFEKAINDRKLLKRVQVLQQTFKNQQNPSLDTAIWWIENLLENPSVNDHLISVPKDSTGFFVRNSLDIFLLFEIIILMCVINTILVCRQTLQNFKKISKVKCQKVEKRVEKVKKLRRDRKEKTKTS
ncbi:UDP-glycosyltransferase family 305 member A1 [Cochliomyia hominivorax]